MAVWITQIAATDPYSGLMKVYPGPEVEASSAEEAMSFLRRENKEYCRVIGKMIDCRIDERGLRQVKVEPIAQPYTPYTMLFYNLNAN